MILVTGFEPFGGLNRNPTADLARELGGAVLPVDYDRIGPALDELLRRDWDAVVLLGLAVGQPFLGLERVAVNFRDPQRPDNAGVVPARREIVPGGPAAYFATLPLDELHASLRNAGLPVAFSLTAGGYLCNTSFYLARHALEGREIPCGVLHLPPTPDLACAALPLAYDEQLRAVRLVVDLLTRR